MNRQAGRLPATRGRLMADRPAADIRRLAGDLTSTDVAVRMRAAEGLAQAGAEAGAAAVELVHACADPDAGVREWVVAALEGLGPAPDGSLAALTSLAGDAEPLTAYWALTLLGRSGAAAAPAVAAIAARLAPPAPVEVRQRAAWALARLGPAAAPAADGLRAAAAADDPRLARLASEALAALGG